MSKAGKKSNASAGAPKTEKKIAATPKKKTAARSGAKKTDNAPKKSVAKRKKV
jgi:hypothetical protein